MNRLVRSPGDILFVSRWGPSDHGPNPLCLPIDTATERTVLLGTPGECGEDIGALWIGLIQGIRTRRITVGSYSTVGVKQLFASVGILFDHDGLVTVITENRGYAAPDGAPADSDGSL